MEATITELAHLRVPLEKIVEATNNFSDKNITGLGEFGKVYKGKLDHKGKMIKIVARRLDPKNRRGDVEFWNEVSTLYTLSILPVPQCDYTVELIGFCDEKGEKIVINRHYPKGSLAPYISNPLTLNFNQRLDIAMNVCWAAYIIHKGTHMSPGVYGSVPHGDYIIHRNINSSTILLDREWNPRLSGFEYSIKHSEERRNQVLNYGAVGTKAYIDPAIEKYGGVNYKSDIYSIGVVLFELLCGRKALEENKLLAPLAKINYEKGTLKDIIHPDLLSQMKQESFELFSKAAYCCLKDDPTLRPPSEDIFYLLQEAKNAQIKKDEMQEKPIFESLLNISSPDIWKVKQWEHWRIELTHIYSPPPSPLKDYARSYTHPQHVTFKQEIEYYDKEHISLVEQKNKEELPKKRQIVSAKLVVYEENVILSELDILDCCRHPNIQSFLGFYHNGDKMMLFYEYISDKCLDDIVMDVDLTWERRLKICIDVAHGLDYLHNGMKGEKMILKVDLSCSKIELDDSFRAKIVGFENSIIIRLGQNQENVKTHKLKRESDVFNFGVLMYQILCNMPTYRAEDYPQGLANSVRRYISDGMLMKMLHQGIKEENYGNKLFLKKGPYKDSLSLFIDTACRCLGELKNEGLDIKVIIKELEKALSFHENHKDPLRMSFNDIKLATHDFDPANCIGVGGFGRVYKGKLAHTNVNGHSTIVVKKLDKSQGQGEKQYYIELEILCAYNHENIIGLIGYSDETNEKLIVYEYASNGSLDTHLKSSILTWRNRLKICIDVATGLNFLHEGIQGQGVVIHRDIKTANILLFNDWKAKVGDFGLCLRSTMNEKSKFVIDQPCGTMDYVDPSYSKSGILTVKSDVYSFGVALFEILSGRVVHKLPKQGKSLLSFLKHKIESKKQNEVVLEAISKEIMPRSLTTFLDIVYQCLSEDRENGPTMRVVLTELKKALEFQDEKNEEDDKDAEKMCEKDHLYENGENTIHLLVFWTLSYGLSFSHANAPNILGYSDADWARCIETRRSTYGYSVFLGGNLVSWSAKKQPTVSRSSCESEYRAMANTASEIMWLTHLLRELHVLSAGRPTLLCDNRSALFLSQNPVSHKRAKHIDIDYHFVRELPEVLALFAILAIGFEKSLVGFENFVVVGFGTIVVVGFETIVVIGFGTFVDFASFVGVEKMAIVVVVHELTATRFVVPPTVEFFSTIYSPRVSPTYVSQPVVVSQTPRKRD
ncbi:uncharacterized protein [Rutidosis leptorrhynchoides]|uniref:uncharacterized protein n=1 Tax=Rutidosis leptorrhynchoides TaxID=125765 RepID=UPI003A9988CC